VKRKEEIFACKQVQGVWLWYGLDTMVDLNLSGPPVSAQ